MVANKFGALPSPKDDRDWHVERLLHVAKASVPLPERLDLTDKLGRVYDQGFKPICAGVAAATCKQWQEYSETGGARFSAQFVYNCRSNYPDEGMFGRDVMKILTEKGCCREGRFQTNASNSNLTYKSIPSKAKKEAKIYRIKGYAQVTTQEGLKQSMYKWGPCYIAFPVYNQLNVNGHFWKPDALHKKSIGGHAVCVVGYDNIKKAFKIRNSWGMLWNLGGYCYYPYADFEANAHWEIWSMVDMANPEQPEPLAPQPKCKCVLL